MASTIAHNTVFPIPKGGSQAGKKQSKHRDEDSDYMCGLHECRCISCRKPAEEVHHLTLERFRMGRRKDDEVAVPICRICHHELHHGPGGERGFWNRMGLSGFDVCERLRAIWRDHRGLFVEMANTEMLRLWSFGQDALKRGTEIYKEKP